MGAVQEVRWRFGHNDPCLDSTFLGHFNFFNFLAMLHGMWDLSSPTRDQTHTHWKSGALTAGPPGTSPQVTFEGGAWESQHTSVSRSVSFLSLSWALLSPFSLWRAPETSSGWEVSGLAEEVVQQEIQGASGVDKGCCEGLLRPRFGGGAHAEMGIF